MNDKNQKIKSSKILETKIRQMISANIPFERNTSLRDMENSNILRNMSESYYRKKKAKEAKNLVLFSKSRKE